MSKKLFTGMFSLLGSSTVSLLSKVALLVVTSRLFSAEEFGIWATVTSIAAVWIVTDFGMMSALRNKLAGHAFQGAKMDESAREYFFGAFYFIMAVFSVLSFAIIVMANHIPINMLFRTADPALQKIGTDLVLIVLTLALLNIPFGIGVIGYLAYNEVPKVAMITSAQSILILMIIIVLGVTTQPILIVAVVYYAALLLMSIAATLLFVWERKWYNFRVNVRKILPDILRLFTSGIKFGLLATANSFIQNAPTVFIGSMIGVYEAGLFNMSQKLYSFGTSLLTPSLTALWSSYTEAAHKGEWKWCKQVHIKINIVAVLGLAAFIGIVVFGGEYAIRFISNKPYHITYGYLALVGILSMSIFLWNMNIALQYSLSKVNIILTLTLGSAIGLMALPEKIYHALSVSGITVMFIAIFSVLSAAACIESFLLISKNGKNIFGNKS